MAGTHYIDMRVGLVDPDWQSQQNDDLIRRQRSGFPELVNFIPSGGSLKTRKGFQYKDKLVDVFKDPQGNNGLNGVKNFQFVPFKVQKFPKLLQFENYDWKSLNVLFYFYLKKTGQRTGNTGPLELGVHAEVVSSPKGFQNDFTLTEIDSDFPKGIDPGISEFGMTLGNIVNENNVFLGLGSEGHNFSPGITQGQISFYINTSPNTIYVNTLNSANIRTISKIHFSSPGGAGAVDLTFSEVIGDITYYRAENVPFALALKTGLQFGNQALGDTFKVKFEHSDGSFIAVGASDNFNATLLDSTDLSAWKFLQNGEYLYLITDKGLFRKIKVELVKDTSSSGRLLGGAKFQFTVEKYPEAVDNVGKGPHLAAAFYSRPFQELPYYNNEEITPDDGGSFEDRTTNDQENRINRDFGNGVWWGQDFVPRTLSILLQGARVAGRPRKAAEDILAGNFQDVHYVATYVDGKGIESDPGPIVSIYEQKTEGFQGNGPDGLNDSDAFYEHADSFSVDLAGRFSGLLVGKPSSFTGVVRDQRIFPNRIFDYNSGFSIGNMEHAVDGADNVNIYPKLFRGGHHRVMPGDVFRPIQVPSGDGRIPHIMFWHFCLWPPSLRDGYKWINIYKKVSAPGTSPEAYPFQLMTVLRIPDNAKNLPGQRGTTRWDTDGSTNNYPYTFRDQGQLTDAGISIGERFYKLGDDQPQSMAFYNQRLFIGNFKDFPMLIRASTLKTEDFRERRPRTPDDGFDFRPHSVDGRILKHMVGWEDLILFTDEAVMTIPDRQGVAAGSFSISERSPYGIGDLPPLRVQDSILFFEKDGLSLRDYKFNWNIGNFKGDDLSVFVKDLFENYQVVDWSFERGRTPLIWCVRSDGILLSITYIKELEMVAWTTHKIMDDSFKVRAVKSFFYEQNRTDDPSTIIPNKKRTWQTYIMGEDANGENHVIAVEKQGYENNVLDFSSEIIISSYNNGDRDIPYVDIPERFLSLLFKIQENGVLETVDSALGVFTLSGEQLVPYKKVADALHVSPDHDPQPGDIHTDRITRTGDLYTENDQGFFRLILGNQAVTGEKVVIGTMVEGKLKTFPLVSTIAFYERNYDDTIKITRVNAEIKKSLPFIAGTEEDKLIEQKTPRQALQRLYTGRVFLDVPGNFSKNEALIIQNSPGKRLELTGINARYI